MIDVVRLTTVALIMSVTTSWLRGLILQNVMEDERWSKKRGVPCIMTRRNVTQALIAQRMREAGIGYDAIRLVLEEYEFDNMQNHWVDVAPGVCVDIDTLVILRDARRIFDQAYNLEYPADYDEAA
jgi:hypothetical protein